MLYHELRRRKDWLEISHQIRRLSGGSSSLDQPFFIRHERLREILLSVPQNFDYFWKPALDKNGRIKLSKGQKGAYGRIYNASGVPITLYEISEIIRRASGFSKRATKRFSH